MDFFERQEEAKKRTKFLLVYFALAIIGISVSVYVVLVLTKSFTGPKESFAASESFIDWGLFARTGMSVNIGIFLLFVNLAILGCVLWFEWLRYLKPFDPVVTSLEVEKRHPGLSSLVVSTCS